METLVVNLAGKTRKAKLYGRDYLVAPLSMLVPGVLNGSAGPLYYPYEEVAKSPESWNHMPIVIYHPITDGDPVSARTENILDNQAVGVVLNARIDGKLLAEGWFDIEATKRVDAQLGTNVYESLKLGRSIELSTGLGVDKEEAPEGSVFNGVAYTHITKNYRPDHLAVLPTGKGACSISAGCGVLVNCECGGSCKSGAVTENAVYKVVGGKKLPASAFAYVPDPKLPSTWKLRIDDAAHVGGAIAAIGKGFRGNKVSIPKAAMSKVKSKIRAAWKKHHADKPIEEMPMALHNEETDVKTSIWTRLGEVLGIVTNEPSHNDKRSQLESALKERYKTENGYPSYCWVQEVYNDSVVYSEGDSMYRLKYSIGADDVVMLDDGDPEEVVKVTQYKPVKKTAENAVANENVTNSLNDGQPVAQGQSLTSAPSTTEGGLDMAVRLTAEQRQQVIRSLVNNQDAIPNAPWKGKNEAVLNALSDDALVAYEDCRKAMTPVANSGPGIGLFDQAGNRVYFDEVNRRWVMVPSVNNSTGVAPVATEPPAMPPVPQAMPALPVAQPVHNKAKNLKEWLASMPPDAESVWNTAMQVAESKKIELINKLTTGMSGEARTAAVQIYNGMTPQHLEILVQAMPPVLVDDQINNRNNMPSYVGSIGGPPPMVSHEEPLLSPVYNFGSRN